MSSVFRKVVDDILGFDLPSNKKKPVAQALVAPGQPVIVPDKDSGDDFLPPGKPEDSVMEETAPETTAPTAPSISNNMNRVDGHKKCCVKTAQEVYEYEGLIVK